MFNCTVHYTIGKIVNTVTVLRSQEIPTYLYYRIIVIVLELGEIGFR